MNKATKKIIIFSFVILMGVSAYMMYTYSDIIADKNEEIARLENRLSMAEERVSFHKEKARVVQSQVSELERSENALKGKILKMDKDLYRMKVALQYEPYFLTAEEIDEREKLLLDISKSTLYGHIKGKRLDTSAIDDSEEILREHRYDFTDRVVVFEMRSSEDTIFIERDGDPASMEALGEIYDNLDLRGKTEKERIEEIYTYILKNYKYYELYGEEDPDYKWLNYSSVGAIPGGDELQCVGYTSLFSHLLFISGIESKSILSKIKDNDNGHSWNEVILSTGEKYYFDLTWADKEDGSIDYKYLWSKDMGFKDGLRYDLMYRDEYLIEIDKKKANN